MYDIKRMTLQEKIGQLLVIGFDGYEYNEHLQEMIETYKAGNIILFSRNIKDLKQLHSLNKKLYKEIMTHTNTIPFMTIDQEGGMVTRIMQEATFFPGNMTLAATNSKNALIVGEMMGQELISLGLNFNLAPVLDVNNNPLNPVIGVRSYSDDPKVVSEFGVNYINGLKSTGVIATAKHFPGHGDTSTDSHYSMTIVPHDRKRLYDVELVPFKAAIDNGIDAIMSAHVLFPAFEEKELPATLSYNVLTNLLRKELSFDGLIISDCMEMKAIDDYFTTAKAALMGIEAGLDLLCISHTFEKQRDAFKNIEQAVLSGRLPIEVLDEKVERILKYKNKINDLVYSGFLNKEFDEVYGLLTDSQNKIISQGIVDNSLTLVKGEVFKQTKKALLIATEPFATTIAEDKLSSRSIIDRVNEELPYLDTIKIPVKLDYDLINSLKIKAYDYEQIIVCTYNANTYLSQVKLINEINSLDKDLHVISTRNPYDFLHLKHLKNFVSLYEYTPNSVRTIIKYLKGNIVPSGTMPVKLNSNPEIGASVYVGLDEYPLDRNLEYLNTLKNNGIHKIFISAHIPEMSENFIDELRAVLDEASRLGLKVILDVSKTYWEKLTDIRDIYSLRFDFGFTDEEIVDIARKYDFLIELNASTVSRKQLITLREMGLDFSRVRISYNFYPKPHTGMTYDDIINRNSFFKSLGLTTMAYIPGINKRPPIYEGLPTIESHRNSFLEANLQELALIGVDEVFFGDSFITEEEIKMATNFDFSIMQIPIVLKKGLSQLELSRINRLHRSRIDESDFLKRSIGRLTSGVIKPFNTVKRSKGSLTVDNEKFGRYQGELCIIKEDLSPDERVNVIGRVICNDFLLKHLTPGKFFKFIIKGEEE